MDNEKYLSTVEAAQLLEAGSSTIRKWCAQGRFPNARKIETRRGAEWEIPESDVRKANKPKMGRPKKEID